jgi:hypothetical protein
MSDASTVSGRGKDYMPQIEFDTSGLPTTSSKQALPWRETRLALLLVRADGRIDQAHRLADKAALARECLPPDTLLAIRMLGYPHRPEVLVVDDVAGARAELADR